LLVRPTGPRAEEGVVSAVVVVSALAVGAARVVSTIGSFALGWRRRRSSSTRKMETTEKPKATSRIRTPLVVSRLLFVALVHHALQESVRRARALEYGEKEARELSVFSLARFLF